MYNRLATGNTEFEKLVPSEEVRDDKKISVYNISIQNYLNTAYNLGGQSKVDVINPKTELTELIFETCSQQEKEQLLKELLVASIESLKTNNSEILRQTLLNWEYTCLWKKNPKKLSDLNKFSDSAKNETDSAVDWREFLSGLE